MSEDPRDQLPKADEATAIAVLPADPASPAPSDFKPPVYVSSLIASINDGAKAAQTGALFFAFIGLYLLAVAFSTTDEDLLRERTISISQLNTAVPVVFSFAVAPIIFVFLYVHTLIRYDMMAANLGQFERELVEMVEDNRERCRHLLANVEFLRALAAPPGSALASWLFKLMSWFLLIGFPLFVLTVIQLSSLRYQDEGIVRAQQCALLTAVLAIVWFVRRNWVRTGGGGQDARTQRMHLFRYGIGTAALAGLVAGNFVWMDVPAPEAKTVGHKAMEEWRKEINYLATDNVLERISNTKLAIALLRVWQQPVDRGLCLVSFGCRYLRVPHTLLMSVNPSAEVLARLRTDPVQALDADIAALEGLNLRGRTLRFVDLEDSRLYAAAVTDRADLRGAFLNAAALTGADLSGARLQGADLIGAQLRGVRLRETQLQGANLERANLRVAFLVDAHLQGANLTFAQLQGANLSGANLIGTNAIDAEFQGANLQGANLIGAHLANAKLQGANLSFAFLPGANLRRIPVGESNLAGADLRHAVLWQTETIGADLSGVDLRDVQVEEPSQQGRTNIQASVETIPDEERRKSVLAQVEKALEPQMPLWTGITASFIHPFVLVSNSDAPFLAKIPADKKISDVAQFEGFLAPYLAKLAETDPSVALGIANRFLPLHYRDKHFPNLKEFERDRALWPDLARRLLDGRTANKVILPDDTAAMLQKFLPPTAPANQP